MTVAAQGPPHQLAHGNARSPGQLRVPRRGMLHNLVGFVVPTMSILLAYPILNRELGATGFSLFLLLFSFPNFMALLDFGVGSAATAAMARHDSSGDAAMASKVASTVLAFYVGVGLLGSAALALFAPALSEIFVPSSSSGDTFVKAFRWASLLFLGQSLIVAFGFIFKGLRRFDHASWTLAGSTLLGLALPAALTLAYHWTVSQVVLVAALGTLATIPGATYMMMRGRRLHWAPPSWPQLLDLAKSGTAFAVLGIAGFLLFRFQQYAVGLTLGIAALGAFVVAFTLVMRVHTFVNAAAETLFPVVAAHGSTFGLRRIYWEALAWSAALAALTLVPIAVVSEDFLQWWIGGPIAAGANQLVPVLCAGVFFLCLSPAPYHILNGLGKAWHNVAFAVWNGMSNVVLLLWLSAGGLALREVAEAFLASNLVTAMAYHWWCTRMLKVAGGGIHG